MTKASNRSASNRSAQGSQTGSGGGARSRSTPIRTGPASTRVVSPAGAANIGIAKGNHVSDGAGGRDVKRPPEPLYTGTMPQVPMGNAKALEVGRGGVGVGRTVHRAGSQSATPVVTAPSSQGEIFPGFPGKRG